MKFHPDRNKEPGAESRFKEIAEAYAVLSDPKKRAEYDARGFAGVADFSAQDLFGGIDFDEIFGGLNIGFGGDADSLFGRFFSRHRRPRQGPRRGADIEASLLVALERVAHGGDETVRLNHPATCPACHGTGGKDGAAPRRCDACQGTGHITQSQREDEQHVLIQHISACPTCYGRGSIIDHPCTSCLGTGQVEREETLSVKIPRGIEEGMVLRLAGKGMPSPDASGATGDLLVVVHTRQDPRFERSGADLLHRKTIALTDAVLGARRTVPTLEGSVSVSIPPGTQPGTVLRLKGKGLPEFGSERHGELFLHITVHIPEKLTAEERELFERLRQLTRHYDPP
jgi:molecular chaperone DnaJ